MWSLAVWKESGGKVLTGRWEGPEAVFTEAMSLCAGLKLSVPRIAECSHSLLLTVDEASVNWRAPKI